MKKSVVVIPTYNSSKTIVTLLNTIFYYQPLINIIVVDDNSPDGTADEIRKYFTKDKRITLLIRKKKEGRGSAVLQGFREALKDKNIEFFIEMDADLCHDPKYISIMIEECGKYDVVIASKYLKESKIKGLNMKRKIFSHIVNFYIKFMLQVPITDYTNGFRCYKRKALEKIDLNTFYSRGFIVLSEIIYRIYKKGGTFAEIPFIFSFNEINKSNFNLTEIKEAFLTILKLRFDFR